MRIQILVNAAGGTVRRNGGVAAQRARILEAFARHDRMRVDLVPSTGAELGAAAERALEAVRRDELDAIVVGGGDGSVGTVAGVLAGSGTPLGVLPLGTLNHFAKDLGIPTDLAGAAGVVAAGHLRNVDVAEVNGRIFVNNSSIGLYPHMVIHRDRQARLLGIGKPLATLLASLHTLQRFPRRRLWVQAAGRQEHYRSPCLFVGNNEYGLDLLTLGTRQRLDAGELCIYVARPRGPLGLVWLALRAAFGGLNAARDLDMLRLNEVVVGSRARRLLVARDGEVEVIRPPLRYRIRPGELRVLAPAPAPAAAPA
jgi:diacylglycerol kinase family enzyme